MDGMLSPDISGLSETNDQSRESCSGHHTNCPEDVAFFSKMIVRYIQILYVVFFIS